MTRDEYWYLCLECGVPTPHGLWTFWRYDDDGLTLHRSDDGDDANLCPTCGHFHRDDDSGAGIMDGTPAEVAAYREADPDDLSEHWADTLAAVTARQPQVIDPRAPHAQPVGDLERGYNSFWGWLREHLTVEECEALELAGIHPTDWRAAAESCVRAARGEADPRPFTTYPDLERPAEAS